MQHKTTVLNLSLYFFIKIKKSILFLLIRAVSAMLNMMIKHESSLNAIKLKNRSISYSERISYFKCSMGKYYPASLKPSVELILCR